MLTVAEADELIAARDRFNANLDTQKVFGVHSWTRPVERERALRRYAAAALRNFQDNAPKK